jgi:outer membrane protein TolC
MCSTRWKIAVVACLLVGAGLTAGARGDEPKPGKDADKLKTLLQERYEAATTLYKLRMEEFKAGRGDVEALARAGTQLTTADVERSEKKEDRVAAYEANLQRVTEFKKICEAKVKVGTGTGGDLAQAEYDRLNAEILLEREKAK